MTKNSLKSLFSPFDCFMVNRSLKTLAIRMEQHMKSAFIIAKWLEKHPKVEKVLHPALPSHFNHDVALKQSYGHSGIFSFIIKDGNLIKTEKFLQLLKVFMKIESPNGFESFMRAPMLSTHKNLSSDELIELKINEGLISVSIGLEDVEDLVNDIKEAFMGI